VPASFIVCGNGLSPRPANDFPYRYGQTRLDGNYSHPEFSHLVVEALNISHEGKRTTPRNEARISKESNEGNYRNRKPDGNHEPTDGDATNSSGNASRSIAADYRRERHWKHIMPVHHLQQYK